MRNEQRVQQAIERIRATVTDPARLHSGSTRFELWATDIFDLLDLAEEVNNLRRQLAEAQAEIADLKSAADYVIGYGRAAVAEAADLRRQLAEARSEIARLRDEVSILRKDS